MWGTFFFFMLSALLLSISFLTMTRIAEDMDKSSVFECGFAPITPCRLSFSLRFYLIALLFLIFDMEVALLLPGMKEHGTGWEGWGVVYIIFLLVLLVGTFYEWVMGFLDWKS